MGENQNKKIRGGGKLEKKIRGGGKSEKKDTGWDQIETSTRWGQIERKYGVGSNQKICDLVWDWKM